MLVLPRKVGESIVINDDIVITVIAIRGDKVRLQIDAPNYVPVHRKEVYEAIRGWREPEMDTPRSAVSVEVVNRQSVAEEIEAGLEEVVQKVEGLRRRLKELE